MNHADKSFNKKRTASVEGINYYGELGLWLHSFQLLQPEIVEVGDGIGFRP